MSLQTELFKLALLQVSISPNPWTGPSTHFNQTLDLATGTVHVELGSARFAVWVDANADVVRITADGASPFSLTVTSTSTRPTTPWAHTPGFFCDAATTNPDVYVDPLPEVRGPCCFIWHPVSPIESIFTHPLPEAILGNQEKTAFTPIIVILPHTCIL